MEKKALINDVSLFLQWKFALKKDTAYRHSKALDTHIHYTVLQVLKGILDFPSPVQIWWEQL